MKKTIVMGLMGLAIVLGICAVVRGADNCPSGKVEVTCDCGVCNNDACSVDANTPAQCDDCSSAWFHCGDCDNCSDHYGICWTCSICDDCTGFMPCVACNDCEGCSSAPCCATCGKCETCSLATVCSDCGICSDCIAFCADCLLCDNCCNCAQAITVSLEAVDDSTAAGTRKSTTTLKMVNSGSPRTSTITATVSGTASSGYPQWSGIGVTGTDGDTDADYSGQADSTVSCTVMNSGGSTASETVDIALVYDPDVTLSLDLDSSKLKAIKDKLNTCIGVFNTEQSASLTYGGSLSGKYNKVVNAG